MSTTFDPSDEGSSSSAAPSSPEDKKFSEPEDAAEEVRSPGYTEVDDSITAVAQESDYEMHASASEDGAVSDDRTTSPDRFPRFDWPTVVRTLKQTPRELLEDDGGESSVMDCLEIQATLDTEDEDPGQVSGLE